MKTTTRLLAFAAFGSALAASAFAQAPNICESEDRTAYYTEYYNNKSKRDANGAPDPVAQKYAHDVGKEYLAKYAAACPDKYTESVSKFVKAYEEASDRFNLTRYAFGTTPDYAKAFEAGRRVLAITPDDLPALLSLAHAGNAALAEKNETFVAEAIADAKKAIELIESGKAPAKWDPYKSQQDALSYLYSNVGGLSVANHDNAAAIAALLKAATLEGPAKSDPSTYGRLAAAYHSSQYDPMQRDFNARFGGKPESAESKFTIEQINQVIDRVIDAYARAVNLSGDNPKYAAVKAAWLEILRGFYKFRVNDAMTGLDEYVANAMTRPLPEPYVAKAYVPEPPKPAKKRH